MNRIDLVKVEHKRKIGQKCEFIKPNVSEDSLLYDDGELIGFYLKSVSGKLKSCLEIANHEFRSDSVPKSNMNRGPVGDRYYRMKNAKDGVRAVSQYSTIIGSCAPKPHMRLPYPRHSQVHSAKGAKTFIKAMLVAAKESEKLIEQFMPEQFRKQSEAFEAVKDKWKFGNIFTSSISNYNIAAPFHQDNANIKQTVNAILTKRKNAEGGCLYVPDYDATFEQADNSLLVYPAWRNVHAVTPIMPYDENGYRNSFIFYPLKAFIDL